MKSKLSRKANKPVQNKVIRNKRASYDYALSDSYILGIVLNGRETKALRLGHGQLQGAYVTVKDGELWLINAQIHGTNGIPISDTDKTRTRKLLAKKREINQLITAKQQGNTLIPTDILTNGRFIKVRVAVGRGKREYDKRHSIKQKTARRDIERDTRNRLS